MKVKIALGFIASLVVIWFYYAVSDRIIATNNFSKNYGNIKVRYVKKHPFALNNLFGYNDGFYRCEYFHMVRQPMKSCISIDESSFSPSKIVISWDNGRQATVYFDSKPLVKCSDGVWEKLP